MIVIVNYGLGNLGSVLNMFKKIGVPAKISENINDIESAEKILIPGVGSFDKGISKLNQTGYTELLNKKVLLDKVPTLGICLGMQLMTKGSEEGTLPGLGWFDAQTVKFKIDTNKFKIPHMGWNEIKEVKETSVFKNFHDTPRFYFVHSYHAVCNRQEDIWLTSNYGYDFVCGIQKDNIYGAQFHPEKSHKFGMTLLKNFAQL